MSNRTAKLGSAIFASLLAGASLATLSLGAARGADDCLAAPKDETPEGSHWYYRIDHANNNRHCWYLRGEGDKAVQIAPPVAASPARPIAPKAETATQRSLADAHAELPPQTRIEPAYRTDQPRFAPPANPPVAEIPPRANPADADPPPSVVASRWPDSSDATSAVSPAPAADNFAANVQPVAAPPPTIAAVPLTAADASTQGRPGSIATLLGVIIGAVAFSSLIASLAFKIGRTRRARQLRARRDAIWQRTDDDGVVLSTDVLPRRAVFARDLDRVDDPSERIEEFLSQLAKQGRI